MTKIHPIEALLQPKDNHDVRLVAMVLADEYIFVRDEAKRQGVSQSAYLRRLVNDDRRRIAQEELLQNQRAESTHDSTQELHNFVSMLAKLVKEQL
ncbi:MAG: hypothetical protein RLZZ469_1669 [Bacteroidota bacterium]|jgi:hypothetical protein